MADKAVEVTSKQNWKTKALLAGAVLGVCVGVAATYILIQNMDEEKQGKITAGEGVKLGVLVLGLLKSIASLGES